MQYQLLLIRAGRSVRSDKNAIFPFECVLVKLKGSRCQWNHYGWFGGSVITSMVRGICNRRVPYQLVKLGPLYVSDIGS